MDDTTTPPAKPRRRRPLLAVGTVVAVALLAGGGFLAGRATSPAPADPNAAQCGQVQQRVDDLGEKFSTDAEPDPLDARTGLNLIVQNPDCFDAETRAGAQAALDSWEQQNVDDQLSGIRDDLMECAAAEDDRERLWYC